MRILLLCVLSATVLHSTAQFNISGKITDEKKSPAKAVSVLLLTDKDSALVTSHLSGSDGGFLFTAVRPGKYHVCVSMIGYERTYIEATVENANVQLNDIKLLPEAISLEEVTVISSKPFLEQRADKLIVNVEASATAAGATALEILQKVPGVLVMNNRITIPGKGSPAIMINGRLAQYTSITQALATINAANIDKIEVISNPGARYDAAGGAVINIVLKRRTNLGTNGSISVTPGIGAWNKIQGYENDNFYQSNIAFDINHRKGKLNLFANYGFLHSREYAYSEATRLIDPSVFYQTNYTPMRSDQHTYKVGLDYFANRKNVFGIVFQGNSNTELDNGINNTQQKDVSSSQLMSEFQTFNNSRTKQVSTSANVNWKHSFDTLGHDLNLDIDYSKFNMNADADITTVLFNNKSSGNQYIRNPLHFWVLKADYSLPLRNESRFEAGAKSSFATIGNSLVFKQNGQIDYSRSADFTYTENINAAYASYEKTWKDWKMQTGLRVEQTLARGVSQSQEVLNRNYWQLFPSFSVTRKINEDLSAVLQYSRRVNRPSYEQQNPFIEYLDSLTYEKGNPLLQPETADEYKLSLTAENQPFFSVSYNKKRHAIVENAPEQIGNITYTMPQNLASFENLVFELNFPLELGNKITGGGSAQAIYNHYKAPYLGGMYDGRKWNWLVFGQIAYKPRPAWSFEVSGFYTSSFLHEFLTVNNLGVLNLGVQHSFWDRKGKLSLNINDVLFSQKISSAIKYQSINMGVRQWEDSRNLRLTFSYSFGNRKLKPVRERSNASEEEADRVKKKKD